MTDPKVVPPIVYPTKPAPRASGYLDQSGVEWNAYDTSQMEDYADAAYALGLAAAPKQDAGAVDASRVAVATWESACRSGVEEYMAETKEAAFRACIAALVPAAVDDLEAMRAQQAKAVMPLIGPLLDAWDALPNDYAGDEDLARVAKHISAVNAAMEGDVELNPAPPAAAPQQGDGWVSVEDRLPECNPRRDSLGVECIVWPKVDGRSVAFYGKRVLGTRAGWYYAGSPVSGITHWRAMPAPPVAATQQPSGGA